MFAHGHHSVGQNICRGVVLNDLTLTFIIELLIELIYELRKIMEIPEADHYLLDLPRFRSE